jgi:hypothetical protein
LFRTQRHPDAPPSGDDPINRIDPFGLTECDEEPCDEQLKQILDVARNIAERFMEYKYPKWSLPLTGKNSRSGHIQQIGDQQRNLMKRINK